METSKIIGSLQDLAVLRVAGGIDKGTLRAFDAICLQAVREPYHRPAADAIQRLYRAEEATHRKEVTASADSRITDTRMMLDALGQARARFRSPLRASKLRLSPGDEGWHVAGDLSPLPSCCPTTRQAELWPYQRPTA